MITILLLLFLLFSSTKITKKQQIPIIFSTCLWFYVMSEIPLFFKYFRWWILKRFWFAFAFQISFEQFFGCCLNPFGMLWRNFICQLNVSWKSRFSKILLMFWPNSYIVMYGYILDTIILAIYILTKFDHVSLKC